MNIQGIQIAQGLLTRAVEGKLPAAKGKLSAESVISVPEISLPAAKENKILPEQSNVPNHNGNAFELVYPPFFPLGNTQGIYEQMVDVAPQPNPVPAMPAAQVQKASSDRPEVRAGAPDNNKPVVAEKGKQVEHKTPVVNDVAAPGSVLDLKV